MQFGTKDYWRQSEYTWHKIRRHVFAPLDNGVALGGVSRDWAQYLIAQLFGNWLPSASAVRLCFEFLQAIEEAGIGSPEHQRLLGWGFRVVGQAAEEHAQPGGL